MFKEKNAVQATVMLLQQASVCACVTALGCLIAPCPPSPSALLRNGPEATSGGYQQVEGCQLSEGVWDGGIAQGSLLVGFRV